MDTSVELAAGILLIARRVLRIPRRRSRRVTANALRLTVTPSFAESRASKTYSPHARGIHSARAKYWYNQNPTPFNHYGS